MSAKKISAAKKPEEKAQVLSRKPSTTPAADAVKARAAADKTLAELGNKKATAAPVALATPAAPAKKPKQKPYVISQEELDKTNAAATETTPAEVPETLVKGKKAKAPKAPKEPKAPRESRSGMIVDMLLAQVSTDEDIYEAVKAKFGDFPKNQISICRCDLNDAKHPKYKAKKEAAGFDNTKTRLVQLVPAPEETAPEAPAVA